MPDSTNDPWRIALGAAALLVFGFFLYSLQGMLNPFLLFLVLWAVLFPFRTSPGHTILMLVGGVLTFLWLLSTTGSLLAPFVLSLALAYILDPALDWLQGRGIPRMAGIVVLTLPVVGLLALVLFVAIPAGVGELADLTQRAPELARRIADWLESGRLRLVQVDLPFLDEAALLERLRSIDSAAVVSFLQDRQEALANGFLSSVSGVGKGLGAALGILSYVVLTPVLTFYLMRDWDTLTRTIASLVPEHRRDSVVRFAKEYDRLLARYLRGQATVALAIGAITALGLWIAGFPYAGTLGLIVAVFSVVPYLGLLLSLIPAVFIALVSGSVGLSLVKVAIVYGVAQGLEGAVISPRVVGDSVGLHPVLVVLALAVGGFFFGFVGLLIAVPAAVGLKLLTELGVERYKASDLYQGKASPMGP